MSKPFSVKSSKWELVDTLTPPERVVKSVVVSVKSVADATPADATVECCLDLRDCGESSPGSGKCADKQLVPREKGVTVTLTARPSHGQCVGILARHTTDGITRPYKIEVESRWT